MIWLLIVPEPLGLWDWFVVALIGAVFLFLMWLCLRRRSLIRYGIAVLLAGLMLVALLFPSVERAHREYYQGHDQFWWVSQLRVGDKAARNEAILALSDILRSSKYTPTRCWIVQELVGHAYEAKELLPVLTEMLKEDDNLLRYQLEETIQQIQAAATTSVPDDFEGEKGEEKGDKGQR